MALKAVSSGRRTACPTFRSGWSSSISKAVISPVAATGLASIRRASSALAAAVLCPTRRSAAAATKAQPPSGVSALEPEEICASPQPTRPSPSRASTRIGAKASKVR
jgi:hypothetical protein